MPANNEHDERTEVGSCIDHLGHGRRGQEILRKNRGEGHDQKHAGTRTEDAIIKGNDAGEHQDHDGPPTTASAGRVATAKVWLEGHEDAHGHHEHDDDGAHDVLIKARGHAGPQPGTDQRDEEEPRHLRLVQIDLSREGHGRRTSAGHRGKLASAQGRRGREARQDREQHRNQDQSATANDRINPPRGRGTEEKNHPLRYIDFHAHDHKS